MSIEDKLDALKKAVEENTKVQQDVVAVLRGGGAKATAGGTTKTTTEAKSGTTKKTATKKSDVPTVEDIAKRFGAYMANEDEDEANAAKANVRALTEHFGVARVSLVPEDKRKELLDMLDQYEAGGDPLADEGGGEDDGEALV